MPNYRSPGVYVEEVEGGSRPIQGVGTAIAAFVGVTAAGPYNKPTFVTNWGQYTREFGEFVPGVYTPLAVYSFFNNGGGAAWIVRVGSNGAADGSADAATAEIMSESQPELAAYRIRALEPGEAGNEITVEVEHEHTEPDQDGTPPADGPADQFTLVVRRGNEEVERHEHLTNRRRGANVVRVVNERSAFVRVEEVAGLAPADRLPAAREVGLVGGHNAGAPTPLRLSVDDFVGSARPRAGIGALEAVRGVTIVAVPDVMAAWRQQLIDYDDIQVVQQALIDHCTNLADRVAVLDPPPGLDAQGVLDWRVEKVRYDSKYAALYWPYVQMYDPGLQQVNAVPPSGAVAGIWGRTDDTRGVHKAPANEIVRGAIDVEHDITRQEHDELNPVGINVIRTFPGAGIRVWGARTLSSDPAWRYLNVRRLFNFMEASILGGTGWVVFEPNDLELWQRIRRTIAAFLLGLWRQGALAGASPAEAFYVKCDRETNPQDVVDAGQVIVEIGVAPVKPAEFVVFRMKQKDDGAGVAE